ncbi:MAG: NAD(P)-dependent oxidoreductase, partial [Chloroflexota bacterium]
MNLLYLGPSEPLSFIETQLPGSVRLHHGDSPESIASLLPTADIILDASLKVLFTAERLEQASALKLFVTATTGVDHIDAAFLEARSIPLWSLKGEDDLLHDITPTVELAWMLLLMTARHGRAAVEHVLAGSWDRTQFAGPMLREKTLGIIGCGRLGTWMATYADAFGMRVLGYDPYKQDISPVITQVGFDEVITASDFISLHVHL